MRSALRLSLLLLALPAAAQPDWLAFFPGAEGDTWTYDYARTDCDRPPGGCTSVYETVTIRVVGTTDMDGVVVPIVEGPGGRAAFGVNPADTTVVREVLEDNGSGLPITPPPACNLPRIVQNASAEPMEVRIGERTYSLRWAGFNCSPGMQYSEGVGLVRFDWSRNNGGGASEFERWKLRGAVIGGESYGSYATSASPQVPGADAFRISPNPTTERATVRLHLATPEESVHVEVIDVLGRVVWQSTPTAAGVGTISLEIDLRSLSAGAYVVRAVAGSQTVDVRRLTKAR
ncbi:T9SS type A sorting domain-containing protein [Rubrivirga sp. IMCC45206]|uniref:T9SS type A sorting domain-containing protein n=1 Tax=Rubrivirga sp. IMCC45206 TaxID=3391614 RepID=UPI0039902D67